MPWELLSELIDAGDLPAFRRLAREGAAGPLRSTLPDAAAPAWPSLATGRRPDGHGTYAFRRLESDYTHRLNTAADVDGPALWDVVTPAVAANVPLTYPACDVDGRMVSGLLTPDDADDWTHPPDLAETVRERVPDYTVGLDWSEYVGREDALRSALADVVAGRRDLLSHLLETTPDWRLCMAVFTAPDRLQRLVWDRDAIREQYRQLDDVLAYVLSVAQAHDAALFVVSCYGFAPVERTANVNAILRDSGHLTPRGGYDPAGLLDRVRARIGSTLDALSPVDGTAGERALPDVDFGRTTAFAHGRGNVYVNDAGRFAAGTVRPAERERVGRSVRQALESAVDPATGDRPLVVHDGDDRYPGDDRAPDFVVRADGYVPRASLREEQFSPVETLAADHHPEGALLARGPGIENTTVEAAVIDVAPTVLHLLGEPIPGTADGRVLAELMSAAATERQVRINDPDADAPERPDASFDHVEDRLRAIGSLE